MQSGKLQFHGSQGFAAEREKCLGLMGGEGWIFESMVRRKQKEETELLKVST